MKKADISNGFLSSLKEFVVKNGISPKSIRWSGEGFVNSAPTYLKMDSGEFIGCKFYDINWKS